MYPAIMTALPRARIAPNMGNPFRDGPIGSLGAGVLSLYHFMSTSRTACIVEQTNRRTPLGDSILLTIDNLVIDSGLYGVVWRILVTFIKKYVGKHSWIYASIKYKFENNVDIYVRHGELSAAREHETTIMERAGDLY